MSKRVLDVSCAGMDLPRNCKDEPSPEVEGDKEKALAEKEIEKRCVTTFLDLNDDCLRLIMGYLDPTDLTLLRLAYPYIQALFAEDKEDIWKGGFLIGFNLVMNFPVATCPELYQEIGGSGLAVTFEEPFMSMYFNPIMPYLQNVKALAVTVLILDLDQDTIAAFPPLTTLRLVGEDQPRQSELMEHLKDTLEDLYFFGSSLEGLKPLRRLLRLELPRYYDYTGLPEILANNQSLFILTVTPLERSRDWNILAEQLYELKVLQFRLCTDFPKALRFNNLGSLHLELSFYPMRRSMSNSAPQLKDVAQITREFLNHVGTQLKHLFIVGDLDDMDPEQILPSILRLTSLRTFGIRPRLGEAMVRRFNPEVAYEEVRGLRRKWATSTRKMIEEIPSLEIVFNDFLSGERAFERELSEYLKEQGRTIKFNEEKLDINGLLYRDFHEWLSLVAAENGVTPEVKKLMPPIPGGPPSAIVVEDAESKLLVEQFSNWLWKEIARLNTEYPGASVPEIIYKMQKIMDEVLAKAAMMIEEEDDTDDEVEIDL